MPRKFRWEAQLARRINKKGRAMGGILVGMKKGIKVVEEEITAKMVKIWGETWRVIGVYINRDLEKWEKMKSWVEDKERGESGQYRGVILMQGRESWAAGGKGKMREKMRKGGNQRIKR